MSNITERAMLARLSITRWTARRIDRAVTAEVAEAHETDIGAGRYNKVLIAREALQKIDQAQTRARTFHFVNTLPWMDDGARILSAANYFHYTSEMQKLRNRFDAEVSAFMDGYPSYVDDARERLKSMFVESDHPDSQQVLRKFSFDIGIFPLPEASDFRVEVGEHEAERIRADIQDRTEKAVNEAVSDTYRQIHKTVGHMAEKLRVFKRDESGKLVAGHFRDSLVENVRALAELLPRLNITADPALDLAAESIKDKLCWVEAQDLRDDPAVRNRVRADAESILEALGFSERQKID